MSAEIELVERYDLMNKVVEEMLKGSSPTTISKSLGISRAKVLELQEEWKTIVHNDRNIHSRAMEALTAADEHFNLIISRAWETVEEASLNGLTGVKVQALKLVADTEQKRMDMLNKAGVLENNELAQRVLQSEKNQEILIGILKKLPSDVQRLIQSELSLVTGKTEAIDV